MATSTTVGLMDTRIAAITAVASKAVSCGVDQSGTRSHGHSMMKRVRVCY